MLRPKRALTKNGRRLTPSGLAPRPVKWIPGHAGSPVEIARVAIDDSPAGLGFMCPREALQIFARRVVAAAYGNFFNGRCMP